MKKLSTITILSFISLIAIFGISCNKSSDSGVTVPTISTYSVISGVTTTAAQAYAAVTGYGGATLTANGLCWSSTNQTPTISDTKSSSSVDTIFFSANLTSLTPNTTYYVRAYATNSAGTGYGNVVKFKTNSATFAITATVSTFAGNANGGGFVNGTGVNAQFHNPQGICTDAQGNMYVADSYNNVIRKITAAGVTTTYAGTGTLGYLDGPAATAQFYAPKGVAADAQGNIYVADMGNNMIRKISAAGVVTTLAGKGSAGYADGTGADAVFKSPAGLAVDASGNIYVADQGTNTIRKVTSAGVVTTLAGAAASGQVDATTNTDARFSSPSGVTVDASGNVYVADLANHAIRKVTSAGVTTTIIGNPILSKVVPSPSGIYVDASGNLFITDASGQVMEINVTTNIIYSLAGVAGTSGFANGTNINALFNGPQALTLDSQGNIYVVDYYNNMIRKIVVTTQQ
ncbi:NHL repeat-containing protein [Mucilaginibacter paludis]|uniref:NHL repeat containing protein n=1 Tax=Mucilaginibacter paludis DSM 18603 TaxID=714943 RepID=H1Y022_9SPHI|nr:NHL repeat-containing protein [Mucilaginibacter paludis]EHQ27931.1 NHL repeat containing protein [Mucilaginibacter paludis DSM 18603]